MILMLRRLGMLLWCLLTTITLTRAQEQCGLVTTISFPVDRAQFQIVQAFGAPSPRHQGRYHTGEDYYGGRGSYGQPVHAIAAGLVTYSAPNGWGRDGGVVIIQHTFPDGTIAYSQYGHMEENAAHPFPARYTCVQAGDIVGVVGNARPAPHVHFEIRADQPDLPGAGYTTDLPTRLGYQQPSKFILNWQTWMTPAHRWHLQIPGESGLIAPPLELPDHSLLLLAATRLRFATPDGRVLWRIILEQPATDLGWYQGQPFLIYADGAAQAVNLDGTFGGRYPAGVPLDSTPLPTALDGDILYGENGRQYVFAGDSTLYAYNADSSNLWQAHFPDTDGQGKLALYDDALLLTTPSGHIAALQAATGAVCNLTRIYGDGRSAMWHSLGDDGLLRVALADQILGLDWARFLGGCA